MWGEVRQQLRLQLGLPSSGNSRGKQTGIHHLKQVIVEQVLIGSRVAVAPATQWCLKQAGTKIVACGSAWA
jgi:hypothetical protein